ncbi:MAG TPA: YdeI/OmpD-associated family protein [Acidimicrobiales bacterium]|jgi:hypothetical protein
MESFEAVITEASGGGAYVEVPPDVVAALGGGGRIAVIASFDGIPYRGSVVSMGGPKILGMLKAIRKELGKAPGDKVKVTVAVDAAERTVEVPDDLAAGLATAGARAQFDQLSYSHQREYVQWIDEAKRPATRARRIDQTIERIVRG